jgi:hypothetical protein
MPKEIIYDEAGTYDVHVGWSNLTADKAEGPTGGQVQVGVETRSGLPLFDQLWPERPKQVLEGYPAFRGVWGSLDRAGCNKLIRVLRRARDQAFGRDE